MVMAMFMIITAMHIPIVFFVGKESLIIIVDEIMRGTIANQRQRMLDEDEDSRSRYNEHGERKSIAVEDAVSRSMHS